VLVLALCACAGIRVASPVRLALELTTAIPVLILAAGLARAYRRYRRDGLGQVAARHADAVPLPARKLMVHEARLFTSTLRWAWCAHERHSGAVRVRRRGRPVRLRLRRNTRRPRRSSLGNGDGQRPNPGHIRLLQGIESYNQRSAGHKHLSMSRYSSCQRDVSGTNTAWLVT
jgi:hypothetical protein